MSKFIVRTAMVHDGKEWKDLGMTTPLDTPETRRSLAQYIIHGLRIFIGECERELRCTPKTHRLVLGGELFTLLLDNALSSVSTIPSDVTKVVSTFRDYQVIAGGEGSWEAQMENHPPPLGLSEDGARRFAESSLRLHSGDQYYSTADQ